MKIAAAAAIKSAIGPTYKMPSIPIKIGSSTSIGKKKMICLVRDRNIPLAGFPMDVKKFDVMICIKLIKVKNRKIRK